MNFDKQTSEIRALSRKLLDEGKVDVVLAYADGDLDDGALIPIFIRSADDVWKIKWGDRCWHNLAPYLHGREDRVAIVAKPCDARAIVQYIIESQLERDKIYIIGMDCPGMFGPDGDPRPGCPECKVRVAPVCDTRIVDDRVTVADDMGTVLLSPADDMGTVLLSPADDMGTVLLSSGDKRTVPMSSAGDKRTVPMSSAGDKRTVPMSSATVPLSSPTSHGESPSGSLSRFREEIDKCILCYSCRQACYGCYCKTCFVQRDMPDWQPAEIDAGTKMTFHIGRAMHLAGRCVECGACEAACASGVNVRYIIKEATDFIEENYDFKTGMDFDTTQAMLTYKLEDKEIGFFGGDGHE